MTEGMSQDGAETRRVVSACYAAASANDAAAIIELMDPDVVLHEAASMPNAGVHRGVDQVMQALGPVFALFDLSRLTIEKIVVDGEYGIGLVDLPFRDRAGESCPVSEVWRVRNSRVVEIRPFYWDTAAIAAKSP
jgi:ketosteroid isomerase-like protein